MTSELSGEPKLNSWSLALQEIAGLKAFVNEYVRTHYPDRPVNDPEARAEAVHVFRGTWNEEERDNDNDFNLPDWIPQPIQKEKK
ncbi:MULTISPECIES: hypothetical protein [unclassified Paenibacillus]|uniref:hypothetical protein n=1 Tax=unclassified Paenibacillus TaxID=185978 RepID=UPI0011156295|nr:MULTISPECIES: hypothetical protein [unclassified Paenibacillus]QID16134.1 hypothetical protein CIC07_25755 [Paenibacillus sp. RUD330]